MHETETHDEASQKGKVIEQVVSGRVQILKGVPAIAREIGLTATKAKRVLEAGQVERAWQVGRGRR